MAMNRREARPGCVRVGDLPQEQRPRKLRGLTGVRARVRAVGNEAGLTRMGVWLRTIEPGDAGTARHFHSTEEEWAYVLAGSGVVRLGGLRLGVRAGSFVGFPPGPAPHHFVNTGDAELVLLEGGERRPEEDVCFYPDLRQRFAAGKLEAWEPGDEQPGSPAQRVQLEEVTPQHYQHPVDPAAARDYRTLHSPAGLIRQAVKWSRVAPGARTTAYHTHSRTDEWVYVLEGRALARVGDVRFEVGEGDFLAHPAGGAAHVMEPLSELAYLMGGQIDPEDVCSYPEARRRKYRGVFEDLPD